MVASTNVFTAGPELPDWPDRKSVVEGKRAESGAGGVPVKETAEVEVKVNVHWPLALVPVEAQVSVMFVAVAPLVLAGVDVGFTGLVGGVQTCELSLALTVTVKV